MGRFGWHRGELFGAYQFVCAACPSRASTSPRLKYIPFLCTALHAPFAAK